MGFTLKELKRKYEKYSSIYVDEGIFNGNLTQEEISELELRLESIKTLIEDYE